MGAFYFFTGIGQYTGESALSLDEFADKMRTVSEASILFHFTRGDFEAWIRSSLHDDELADHLKVLRQTLTTLHGETLRAHIVAAVMLHRTSTELPRREPSAEQST
jgi:hypothetical protein